MNLSLKKTDLLKGEWMSFAVDNEHGDLETICTIGEMIDLQDTRLSMLTYESKDLLEMILVGQLRTNILNLLENQDIKPGNTDEEIGR